MTKTVYTSLETFREIATLLDERAALVHTMKKEKARLAKENASLEKKVQSENFYMTYINPINDKLRQYQGSTIMAA